MVGRYLDRFTGPGVTPLASLAVPHLEDAGVPELDAVASADRCVATPDRRSIPGEPSGEVRAEISRPFGSVEDDDPGRSCANEERLVVHPTSAPRDCRSWPPCAARWNLYAAAPRPSWPAPAPTTGSTSLASRASGTAWPTIPDPSRKPTCPPGPARWTTSWRVRRCRRWRQRIWLCPPGCWSISARRQSPAGTWPRRLPAAIPRTSPLSAAAAVPRQPARAGRSCS